MLPFQKAGAAVGILIALSLALIWFSVMGMPTVDLVTLIIGATVGTMVAFWARRYFGMR